MKLGEIAKVFLNAFEKDTPIDPVDQVIDEIIEVRNNGNDPAKHDELMLKLLKMLNRRKKGYLI